MKKLIIGTFNCENMFTRYNFLNEGWNGSKYVDFIRPTIQEGLVTFASGKSDVPLPKEITRIQRKNTAAVIMEHKPDILAVQEIENLPTMRIFNDDFLKDHFKYAMSIEGNDKMRLIDVGLYSNYPIVNIRTSMFDLVQFPWNNKPTPVFSRDCLFVEIEVESRKKVVFLVNHFKAQDKFTKRGDKPSQDVIKRQFQAERVAQIASDLYQNDKDIDMVVLGDLNCPPPVSGGTELEPLFNCDALKPIINSHDGEDWTYYLAANNAVSKLDHIFLSKALFNKQHSDLIIERAGISPECQKYSGARFPDVTKDTEASDHCGVFMEIEV